MSLTLFNVLSRGIEELRPFFIGILEHLQAKNYRNGSWTPTITGLTGGDELPAIAATYQRWGTECTVMIVVAGTQEFSEAATISLPEPPAGPGLVVVHSLTSNATVGTGAIDVIAARIKMPPYQLTEETVIIRGSYQVKGI